MGLNRVPPTPLTGDGRHYGPGFRFNRQAQTGPAIQTPKVKAAAQTDRASQIAQGSVPNTTNTRTISRDGLTPGNLENYGAGD